MTGLTISFEAGKLLEAARDAATVVKSGSPIPILGHLAIVAAGGVAQITGSDLDHQIELSCPVDGDAAFTLSADKLVAALGTLRPGAATMAIDAGKAVIAQGRSRRTVATLPIEDFPRMTGVAGGITFETGAGDLLRILDAVHVAMSKDMKARAFICGVHLCVEADRLVAVATDGYVMISCRGPLPAEAAGMQPLTISAKTVGMLRKLLAKPEGMISIATGGGRFSARSANRTLIAKVLEGDYPGWRRMIPDSMPHVLAVRAGEIKRATDSVIGVINAEGNVRVRRVKMMLGGADDIRMETSDSAGASAIEPFDGAWAGEPCTVTFDSDQLRAMTSAFDPDAEIHFGVSDPMKPLLATSPSDPSVIGVVSTLKF